MAKKYISCLVVQSRGTQCQSRLALILRQSMDSWNERGDGERIRWGGGVPQKIGSVEAVAKRGSDGVVV